MSVTVVVPDAHIEAGEDPTRFMALGNYLVENQIPRMVQLGDLMSVDALSAWDLSKRAIMENRRFKEELRSGRDCIEALYQPIKDYNRKKVSQKKRLFFPEMIFLEGNHEDRVKRYLENKPEISDIFDDIPVRIGIYEHGGIYCGYRDYIYRDGIAFTHVPMNGNNQPISNTTPGTLLTAALKDHDTSVVFGHTHRLAYATDTRNAEKEEQITALMAGCFFEGTPEYAKGSKNAKDWWRGIVVLHHNYPGSFDIETISLEKLVDAYS